jgi:hypothetical protein
MATKWAVFVDTGFSVLLSHDNEPTQAEMKEQFIKKIVAYLQGEYEFQLISDGEIASDPIEE